jgi:diguanylate cyclase (GGDEF)-like protein
MSVKHDIVVVDDNATNRKILVRALEKDGYDVREAADGFIAVDLVKEQQPSLLLLDIMMPGRDGFEVCEILKADPVTAAIPIIFVTAKSESEDIERAFALGGCDYITKPFRLSEVRARVSVHLNLQNAQSELVDRNQRLEHMSQVVAETNLKLARQARTDSLTSLFNRRAWEECVTTEDERHVRHESPYSILMLDVDQFKAFNDTLGHQAGDKCLEAVAACLTESCRTTDVVGRYGGEEFVILATETDLEAALLLGERIRVAVESLEIDHPASTVAKHVTVSIGAAVSGDDGWESVLRIADQAMYVAKQTGRNRVCSNKDIPEAVANENALQAPGAVAIDLACDRKSPGPSEQVLLVLTDQDTRHDIRVTLEAEGYTVTDAGSEGAASDAIALSRPDAVVLDASLPNDGAIKLTRIVREQSGEENIPVIVICPESSPDELRDYGIAGADECIAYAMCPNEVERRIRYALQRSTDRQMLAASYDNRGEQTRILMLLFEFCRNLVDRQNRVAVLEETTETISAITGCRRVAALIPCDGNSSVRVEAAPGFEPEFTGSVHPACSVLADVLATGRTVVLNDKLSYSSEHNEAEVWFDGQIPQLFIAVPVRDSIGAVIAVGNRVTGLPFDQRILDSVDLVIGVAATALHGIATAEARDSARDAIMIAFAKLAEHRDDATYRHVERVTTYSVTLALALRETPDYKDQITDRFLYDLERGVPLHDIGKVAVPDSILLKKGRLTPTEMAIMQKHANAGADTIHSVRMQSPDFAMLEIAEQIARAHHEWHDGSGYPNGLSGKDIPLVARIVSVADAYDAITTRRPYKEPIPHEKAITLILEASGTQFDPAIVDAFIRSKDTFDRLRSVNADGRAEKNEDTLQSSVPIASANDAPCA